MSFIISDESGTSGATHARDAWGWPRQERPTDSVPTFAQRDFAGSVSTWSWTSPQGRTA